MLVFERLFYVDIFVFVYFFLHGMFLLIDLDRKVEAYCNEGRRGRRNLSPRGGRSGGRSVDLPTSLLVRNLGHDCRHLRLLS